MKPRKQRRPGATEIIGVSLSVETKRKLKVLAEERHQGNVSALVAEMIEDATQRAAFERAWQWYGGAEPSPEARAKIYRQLDEGWAHARKRAKRSRRKTAA